MRERQVQVMWETIDGVDWAKRLKTTFDSMYPDMETKIINDQWYKEKAVFKTKDSLREVKLKFLETFLSIDCYKFRNLIIKEVKPDNQMENQS